MRKTKLQKGITLIALIITIVVLLILAVVAISAVQESDIIVRAKEAVKEHEEGKEKELITLAYSEYFMGKVTDPNATLKVEGAQVTGSEDTGWTITFDETNNTYEVNSDGNVINIESEKREEVITSEKEIVLANYEYYTMYNLNQPEIVPARGFYDDKDNNKISDYNQSLGARIYDSTFNIPKDFFTETIPTQGDILATITYLDGEEKEIILRTEDNRVWKFNETGTTGLNDPADIDIVFIPYAKTDSYGSNIEYEDTQETHVLRVDGEVIVPIQKLNILGKTIEFPFNCQAMIVGGDIDAQELIPMYTNINNVSKITINFSNNTNKVYTKDDIFNASSYSTASKYYSSQDVPILYDVSIGGTEGVIMVNMPDSSLKMQIQSITIEEEGVSTKFNVEEGITRVEHITAGS